MSTATIPADDLPRAQPRWLPVTNLVAALVALVLAATALVLAADDSTGSPSLREVPARAASFPPEPAAEPGAFTGCNRVVTRC